VAQVIAEGLRSGHHAHVKDPKPPVVLFGDPAAFQKLHDDHVAQRSTRVVKNGIPSQRAIRSDRHTLFTIVASYPVPTAAVEASTEEQARLKTWADRTLKWVQRYYGAQLKTAFAHVDEEYPHVHFWLLPDYHDADATHLHLGKRAKRATEAGLKADGVPAREAVAAGNAALKRAMRSWQDSYHRDVGAPLGLSRDGPRRRRLSRAQWAAEQAMLAHHRTLEEDRKRLEAHLAALEDAIAVTSAKKRDLETKAMQFVDRAERHQMRMQAEAAQVAAVEPMLDALVSELETGTLGFDPDGGWRMQDPSPFRAAGRIWAKLEPSMRRFVRMVQAAEEGRWSVGSVDPEAALLRSPDPAPSEEAPSM
jgi:hypothetical protein